MDIDKRDELLFQILGELYQIRVALTSGVDPEPQFKCTRCDTRLPAGELEDHARREHKWHRDLGEAESMRIYERIN